MCYFVFFVEVPLPSPQDDFVIDIGDVHDESDFETKVVSQDAPNDVCGDIVSGMTQVGIVVNRRSAGIP